MAETVRMEVLFAGRVQGVGFRYTTQNLAHGFEVVGTVRNLPDGRVELLAEGTREELEAFQQAIAESDLAAFIKEREVHWRPARGGLNSFRITL
jgi:acylphosphatase